MSQLFSVQDISLLKSAAGTTLFSFHLSVFTLKRARILRDDHIGDVGACAVGKVLLYKLRKAVTEAHLLGYGGYFVLPLPIALALVGKEENSATLEALEALRRKSRHFPL